LDPFLGVIAEGGRAISCYSGCRVLETKSLFGWLVAYGWCWFVLKEEYWWLVCSERKVLLAGG
jgi:hypothetical protein